MNLRHRSTLTINRRSHPTNKQMNHEIHHNQSQSLHGTSIKTKRNKTNRLIMEMKRKKKHWRRLRQVNVPLSTSFRPTSPSSFIFFQIFDALSLWLLFVVAFVVLNCKLLLMCLVIIVSRGSVCFGFNIWVRLSRKSWPSWGQILMILRD